MSSRCKTFSASSAGASTRKGTWWGYSARPEFGRASPNGSSLGASSCRQISSRRWRRCPGKRVDDGSPVARSLGARDRELRRGHAGHLGARAVVAVVDRTGAEERCSGAAAFVRGTEQRRPGGLADPESRWLQSVAARVPQLRDLANLLGQAGIRWSARGYLLITLGSAVGLGFAAFMVLRLWAAALVAASAGACLPYLYLRRRKMRFIRTFEEQLPEAIDLLGRAIRAGHPLSAGLKMAADEAAEPVAGAFRRVFEEQRFGIPFEDVLMGLADRIDLVDVRILVTAILIQRDVGGNLAEVLDKISHTTRARFTIRRQVRVHTAQGRFSGYVLAVLPIAVGSAIFAINREYMLILFQDPLGHWLLWSGVMLQILGYLWIRRIVNIEI